MSGALDLGRHVLIVTAAGSFTVAGRQLSGPVDSAGKLDKLMVWAAHKHGGLKPIPGVGDEPEPARVWVTGGAVQVLTGEPGGAGAGGSLGRALAVLVDEGWEIRGGRGPESVVLAQGSGSRRVVVEVLAEQLPWLAGGEAEVAEDAVELGRRLRRWYAAVGVLPGSSGAFSGAVVADHVLMARRAGGRGAVVTTPGALPGWIAPEIRIQPAWAMPVELAERELRYCDELICLTQLCPALASAGMLTLGHGQPQALDGGGAVAAARAPKRPFGLWLVDLPAAEGLSLPDTLPLPHPQMAVDHRVQAWVSTEDLDGLTKDIRDGGAGIQIGDLDISEAIVWPQQSRMLESWAALMRQAREAVADDARLLALVDGAASDYLAALADPHLWNDDMGHHFQPAWAAAIATHIRMRGRRAAMRISREYRAWPLYVEGATVVYGPARPEEGDDPVDLSDSHTRLGRNITVARAELSEETILAVLLAESASDVAGALTSSLGTGVDHDHRVDSSPVPDTGAGEAPDADPQHCDDEDAAEGQGQGVDEERGSPEPQAAEDSGSAPVGPVKTPRARPAASAGAVGGIPAAVLDTDGLWLPDGTRVEVDPALVHVGQIAELAYAHGLGFRLSDRHSEPGQIWLSVEACEAVGINVAAIDYADASNSLRGLTTGIPFVERAFAAGWRFGGVKEREHPRLGTWTRVYRDGEDRKGVWVVLTAGLGDADSMPIFGDEFDEPTPAQVALRLHLLADALGFPWKINAGVTAIDMMTQSRPQTWSPRDWKNVVMAPSTTDVPYGIADVEADFNWSREPTSDERAMKYLHAYDRGGSYVAGIAGTELPIGAATHHPNGAEFDPRVPGYHRTLIPDQEDWRQPYVLNPKGYNFTEPKWVCTPRLERAISLGYDPKIVESYTWKEHGRVLLGWYDRFRNANVALDLDDADYQAARNQSKIVRTHGVGIIGSSEFLKGKPGFNPERRFQLMAKANANITYRINDIGVRTGSWPLAVLRDTVLYASNDVDPDKAWPGGPKHYGRGFGQYKPERSGLLEQQLPYLNGRGYQGKSELEPIKEWRQQHGLGAAAAVLPRSTDTGGV